MILDGYEVKIGDPLYALDNGWVTVAGFRDMGLVRCEDEKGVSLFYLKNGGFTRTGDCRALYWDKPVFDPPPKPVKTKKWQYLYRSLDGGRFVITSSHYANIEEFGKMYPEVVQEGRGAFPYLPSEKEEVDNR